MRLLAGALIGLVVLGAGIASAQPDSGEKGNPQVERVQGDTAEALAEWDRRIPQMVRTGALRLREEREQPDGARDQWFDQLHRGVPVESGSLWRRVANRSTQAISGTLYRDIRVDPVPKLTRAEAEAAIQALAPERLGSSLPPDLLVLPKEDGAYVLVYRSRVFSGTGLVTYYVDATTAAIVRSDEMPGPP